jgi:hypothetical protein
MPSISSERSTIRRILQRNGILPAPERDKGMPWNTFLRAHWRAITAAKFFSLEIITRNGLVRYFVLFAMDLKTRRLEVAGIIRQSCGERMKQVARNLTDAVDGCLKKTQHLIHDRDPLTKGSVQRRERLGECSAISNGRWRDE